MAAGLAPKHHSRERDLRRPCGKDPATPSREKATADISAATPSEKADTSAFTDPGVTHEVNRAAHYQGIYEQIDMLEVKLGREGMIAWLRGEIDTYLTRLGRKGSDADKATDAGKARFYATLLEALLLGRTISTTRLPARVNIVFEPAHPPEIRIGGQVSTE